MNCEMRGTVSAAHQGQPVLVGPQSHLSPGSKEMAQNSQRTDDMGITSLVLTRREREAVVVDDGRMIVRVSAIQGKRVRLQFLAPAHVRIVREEIYDLQCGLGDTTRIEGGGQC